MTEAEYRQAEGVNKSTLWNLRKSPAHYKYYLENAREDTAAYKFGRAVHAAILTPEEYKTGYAVAPEVDRRTKAGKDAYQDFLEASAGKEILSAQDAETIKAIADAYQANRDAVALLEGTKREEPIFWTDDNGILCKCKVDAYKAGIMIDLKTTQDAETGAFTREALRYGYDVQAAHYIDAYQHTIASSLPEWYFIAIEKAEPYAINILRADAGFIDHGFIIRQQLIERLKACRDVNSYPGYGMNELYLPAWAEGEIL